MTVNLHPKVVVRSLYHAMGAAQECKACKNPAKYEIELHKRVECEVVHESMTVIPLCTEDLMALGTEISKLFAVDYVEVQRQSEYK